PVRSPNPHPFPSRRSSDLSHYRFAAVIGVGVVALLALPQGRQALRDPRLWIAIAFGAAAWTPLLAWNFENAEAGLRFQLVDRHRSEEHTSELQSRENLVCR